MKNIKVCLSGPHSQGKTTLLDRLARDQFLAEKNFRFSESFVRELLKMGINISEAGTDITQAVVISKHVENAYREGNWVLDRCIMDSLAYAYATRKRNGIQAETVIFNEIVFRDLVKKYNIIFYIKPELKLVNDGVRSLDEDYFNMVVEGFNYIIEEFGHDLPIVVLSGSVEERYNKAMAHIKELFTS